MDKIKSFTKRNLTFFIAGGATLLLTGFFYILVSILWNSITEFYAEQSNEQILTGLSKDISEGNYFGFISTLGRIKMNGSLKEFGIIESNNKSSKSWLHVSSELFKQRDISYYACNESIRMISQYGSRLLISSPIPSVDNTKASSCLVLEFQL